MPLHVGPEYGRGEIGEVALLIDLLDAAVQKDRAVKGWHGAREEHLWAAAPKTDQFVQAMQRSDQFAFGGYEEDYKHITEHHAPGLAQRLGCIEEEKPAGGKVLNGRRLVQGVMTTYMEFGEVRLRKCADIWPQCVDMLRHSKPLCSYVATFEPNWLKCIDI